MTEPIPYPEILTDRELFLSSVVEKLGTAPCDFQTTFRESSRCGKGDRRRAAGVLLPLIFSESSTGGSGEFEVLLIKRSSLVPQPGDLSFPGGMLHPVWDRILSPLLLYGPFNVLRGAVRAHTRARQAPCIRMIALFLANALREAWEEIRLSPFRVRFLGPLPTYNLTLFRRTIFPLVGFVENPLASRPNPEVDKIVRISLSSFYRPENFGCHQIDTPGSPGNESLQYPCMIFRDSDGGEEILWGATFHIMVRFLAIVADYRLPDWKRGPVVIRPLRKDYLTGSPPL
jgi:8-oxo-dGTP pyrophosphatase MutT (NUDIX family)